LILLPNFVHIVAGNFSPNIS